MDDKNLKKQLAKKLYFEMNKYSVITMAVCILLNMGGYLLSYTLNLPYWLDSVGTMAASVQFCPLAGSVVAVVSTYFLSIFTSYETIDIVIATVIAIMIGFFFTRDRRDDMLGMVSLAILTGILVAIIGSVIDFYLSENTGMGHSWGDAMYLFLSNYVSGRFLCGFLAEAFIYVPDLVLSLIISVFLVDFEQTRILKKKRMKWSDVGSGTAIMILIIGFSVLLGGNITFAADSTYEQGDNEYDTVFYDSSDGILASEINAVVQTNDGFIWVGTYSGLYVYDGITFENANIDPGIRTVIEMMVDSEGYLWIGTNDSGVFCYDPKTRSTKSYSTENSEMDANSIRTIGEDSLGNIYIGTVLSVTKITPSGDVSTFDDWDNISYAQSFADVGEGRVVGVTNTGILFMIKDDKIIDTATFDNEEGEVYRCVEYSGNELLVGTSTNCIERFSIENDTFKRIDSIDTGRFSFFNYITYSEDNKAYYICCENGLGALNHKTYKATDMSVGSFDGAVSDACVDSQGNIWFASSKHGIMKYSVTPFENVTGRASTKSSVVNAVLKDNDLLYIGRDDGLEIIDISKEIKTSNNIAKEFDGVRIRSLYEDSKGNIWISQYGGEGISYLNKDGEIVHFSEKVKKEIGSRVRSATELSDGRMLIAGNDGVVFLKDGKVDCHINTENGMNNQYILSVMERDDGSILAASDGDGIYVIKDDEVVGHIGSEEGLKSAVVLRIVKSSGGYLYITSNAVYLDDGENINMIESFPYSNNYDIQISEDKTCWVTSSAGLYVVSEAALLSDSIETYKVLNKNWGLNTTFTANSWNDIDGEYLYLCCTDGVRRLSTEDYNVAGKDYNLQLKSIDLGDFSAVKNKDGKWYIPPYYGRIMFNIAVNNYSLSNPLIRYYLEGPRRFSDDGMTAYQSNITPLIFTDLPYGEYKLHIQVIDENTGKVTKEKIERIEKEAMMYEKPYFVIYVFLVLACAVAYIIWLFVAIHRRTSNIRGMRKEINTDPMTGILNKAGSTKALKAACKEETGCLLMIDLDSFKLVNDLYGHDMGDRILIRFAELLKEASNEGDTVGRMGGDEFVGFLRNTMDEEDIDKFTRFLNREIVKSAKEYMGEDMNIPLGTSIGAVRVPTFGRDFDELFRLADKALYVVKQNGKHGYSFYQKKSESKDLGSEGNDTNNLAKIKQIIGERNEGKGAYSVNFDRFQVLYKYVDRSDKVNEKHSGFIRFILTDDKGEAVSDEIRDSFEEHLIVNLKKNDVVSIYSGSFFVLLTDIGEGSETEIAERIVGKWNEQGTDSCNIKYETENVG